MNIVNNKPVSRTISIEDVKTGHFLKLKDLRKFVEDHKELNENTPVVIDRIDDSYFFSNGDNGWKTLKVHWETNFYGKSTYNKDAYKTIVQSYSKSPDNPIDHTLLSVEEDKDGLTVEQYSDGIPAYSIHVTKDKETKEPVVFITPHY